jgi:hypothetical protein
VQFAPLDYTNWANAQLKLSQFRGELPFYIYTPWPQVPPRPAIRNLSLQVGGFIGLGSKNCITTVRVHSMICTIGQNIQIVMECDNSNVDKKVRSFNVALDRTHWSRSDDHFDRSHK